MLVVVVVTVVPCPVPGVNPFGPHCRSTLGERLLKLNEAVVARTLETCTLKGAGQPEGVNSTAPISGVVSRAALFKSSGTILKTFLPAFL